MKEVKQVKEQQLQFETKKLVCNDSFMYKAKLLALRFVIKDLLSRNLLTHFHAPKSTHPSKTTKQNKFFVCPHQDVSCFE